MKNWINIILCVALSAGLWLIHNLSQESSGLVSVPVIAQSNIPGRAADASAEVLITARAQSTGYLLYRLSREHSRPSTVKFDAEDLVHSDGDYYSISENALSKYTSAIFGEGVTVLSFTADNILFRFEPQDCRKVPVRPFVNVSYRPQYTALDEIGISPDSVLVYADPDRLEMIDAVFTDPINLRDVHSSIHGPVKIETPVGVRLSESEVEYSLEVTRFIEFRRTLPVEVRGAPRRSRVSVLPFQSTVTFRCVFPIKSDPSESVKLYVDYDEFVKSIDGSCIVNVDGLPSSVISYRLDPEVCVCVEVEQ
ncbi:MAG: hypothetical protein MJY89_00380 [Bacteroidales bacterium]|nr:hypothetical protein [Bacteroidales bacterium]